MKEVNAILKLTIVQSDEAETFTMQIFGNLGNQYFIIWWFAVTYGSAKVE